ncbi:hypothetical protein ACFO1V_14975 [Daeguia caeni]|uniref:Uncharacterized protein n=1 Tax=Daeguia caeni TaxID=439612 RepID=A0ABV9HAE0_9HYPH
MTKRLRLKASSLATVLALSLAGIPASSGMAHAEDLLTLAPRAIPTEVNNFKLTDAFLAKLENIHKKLATMQLSATEEEGRDPNPSFDQMVASIQARPQVMEILNAEGVKPRDYIIGYFALMNSLAAADAAEEEQLVDELRDINPAHLEFGKKHSERIRELIGE